MALSRPSWRCLTRAAAPASTPLQPCPHHLQQQIRAISANAAKYRRKDSGQKSAKKKKGRTMYRVPDLKQAEQFSLCDAMRYIRAFEVGQGPTSAKYDLAVKLNTMKNGPVIRNRLRLPFPVDTSTRVCVICVPGSKAEQEAIKAGAVLYGEEEVFKTIKEGKIEFDRCICHADSTAAMAKAQLGRILGPRGLMPNAKTGTVVKSVARAVSDMMGASQYRERSGVIRLAIGQLGYTPEEMQRNLVAFMTQVKQDCAAASDRIPKDVFEVVLSSTQSPGFSLNGNFRSPDSPSTQALSV